MLNRKMISATLVGVLLFCFSSIQAQNEWVPKFQHQFNQYKLLLSYQSTDEIYMHNGKDIIYHTKNHFQTFDSLISPFSPNEGVIYFNMSSKSNGTIVTKSTNFAVYDSCFVYVTNNGGYDWTRVFTLPVSNNNNQGYPEDCFFQTYNQKLFILWGNVICWGNLNGENWQTAFQNSPRDFGNEWFKVYNDSIWIIQNFPNSWGTSDFGKSWNNDYILHPQLNNYSANLGASVQQLNGDNIMEFDFNSKKWNFLTHKQYLAVKQWKQLSNRYLLIKYFYWPDNVEITTVYDRKENAWTDLDLPTTFFDYGYDNYFETPTGFAIFKNGRIEETTNFGISWSTVYTPKIMSSPQVADVVFRNNVGLLAVGSGNVYCSSDSGESWRKLARAFPEFSTRNTTLTQNTDEDIYLSLGGLMYAVDQSGDSFTFNQVQFTYNNTTLECCGISSNPGTGKFLIANYGKNLGFFEVNNNQLILRYMESESLSNSGHILQTKDYVVFNFQNKIFRFDRFTKKVDLITDKLNNKPDNMFFSEPNKIVVSTIFQWGIVDLNTAKTEVIVYPNEVMGALGVSISCKSPNNQFLVSNGFSVYQSGDYKQFELVGGMHYLDRFFKIRNQQNTLWAISENNLYKYQDVKKNISNHIIDLKVWPNPFKGAIHLNFECETESDFHFQMYNMLGQPVYEETLQFIRGFHSTTLHLEYLAQGMYFLRVKVNDEVYDYKMLRY